MALPTAFPAQPERRPGGLYFVRGSTPPPVHLRWQRAYDPWSAGDRDLRWHGNCLVCHRNVYAFDDGDNDPRGILGDNALWVVHPEGDDETIDLRTCAECANDAGRQRRARQIAADIGFAAAAPLAWPRLAYHATSEQNWQVIRDAGLAPQPQAQPGEDRCLPPGEAALFFCPTAELAAPWGEVVVAFPWPADAAEDSYGDTMLTAGGAALRTNWHSRLPVPPAALALVQP